MSVWFPARIALVFGVTLLGSAVLRLYDRGSTTSRGASFPDAPPSTRDPFEAAVREALRFRTRAELAVNEEREARERAGTAPEADLSPEVWRRSLMARDANGDLAHARAAAVRAAALARTAGERYRVAVLRVRL